MNDTVQAIILSQSDYRDYDVLIKAMSAEYGLIGFIASGARRMSSKNAGSILPFTKAEIHFDYKEGRSLFRLKTARTKQFYRKIHDDLNLSAAVSVIGDVCSHLCEERTAGSKEEYELLDEAMRLLNEGCDPHTVICLYISDMMKLFGIGPDVDECVHCGSLVVTALSAKEGGFLCAKCAEKAQVPSRSITDLKRFRLLIKGGLKHIEIILKAGGAVFEDLEILIEMLRLHAGLELRSFAFYKRFFTIEPVS